MKKTIIYSWAPFLGSYFILLLIDYLIRSGDGNIKTGGISLTVFWAAWIPFILYSLYKLYSASKIINNIFYKILFIAINITAPVVIILLIGVLYTIESGIDSL